MLRRLLLNHHAYSPISLIILYIKLFRDHQTARYNDVRLYVELKNLIACTHRVLPYISVSVRQWQACQGEWTRQQACSIQQMHSHKLGNLWKLKWQANDTAVRHRCGHCFGHVCHITGRLPAAATSLWGHHKGMWGCSNCTISWHRDSKVQCAQTKIERNSCKGGWRKKVQRSRKCDKSKHWKQAKRSVHHAEALLNCQTAERPSSSS